MATRSKNRPTPTQARAARRARRRNKRRFLRIGAFSAVGLMASAFIVSLFLPSFSGIGFGGFGGGSAPDGPGERVAEVNRTHISDGAGHGSYNSVPATSGWHYAQPLAPVRWGVHEEFLADEIRLHNLEHGGVGVHYNCPDGCDELVGQLTEIVDRSRDGGLKVLLSPYPDMPTKISLTAWTFIDAFDEFDEERVKDFIRSHESSQNAPEPTAR